MNCAILNLEMLLDGPGDRGRVPVFSVTPSVILRRGGCHGPHQDANLIGLARRAFDLATADGMVSEHVLAMYYY